VTTPVSQSNLPPSGGLLVALEGIDGSGKTTAAQALVARLVDNGIDAIYLREPTDGPFGRELRECMVTPGPRDAQQEFELFLADRHEDVETNIRPALKRGAVVCIDRYYISSMAYQGALGIDVQKIQKANEAIAPPPDVIFYFHISVEKALARIRASRTDGTNQFERAEYLARVSQIFESMSFPQMVTINAEDDPAAVLSQIYTIVSLRVKSLT